MNFKEGQRVELNTFCKPVDGKPVVVQGRVTKLMHAHAIVCFESISEGARIAAKRSGNIHLLGQMDKLEPGWTQLNVGDIEAVPLDDLWAVEQPKPAPEWISKEQAKCWISNLTKHGVADLDACLDSHIQRGTIKQSMEGLLRASDVEFLRVSLPTFLENIEREQLRTAEEQSKAQEARRYVEKVGQLSSR